MTNNYTKTDLVNDIANASEFSKKDITNLVDLAGKFLIHRVKNGDKINFIGAFNAFVKRVAAKKGRNPKTGEAINIAAHNKISVKISNKLNEEVQN